MPSQSVSGSVSVSQGNNQATPRYVHGISGRNSSRRRHRRKERFFRFILRRRPCYIMFFVQIGIAVGLFFAFTALLTRYYAIAEDKERLALHDEIYEARKANLTFLHCGFGSRSQFDKSECSYRCDEDAVIYRQWFVDRSPSRKKETCDHIFEVLACTTRRCGVDSNSSSPTAIIETACLGKHNGFMRNHHVAIATIPKVPRIELSNPDLGKTIFINELIVQCPRCRVMTHWSKKHKLVRCERHLKTLQEGWPWDFRFCNYVERGSCEAVKLNLNEDGEDNY